MSSNVLPSPSIQMARSLHQVLPTPHEVSSCDSWTLFQYQMECGSTESAVDAMKRLYVVCILMGSDGTIATILPYLTNMVTAAQQPAAQALSDEILLLLGQQLMSVIQYVTVNPQCTVEYLPLVERLCGVEETVVRDQAVTLAQCLCQRNAECQDSAVIEASLPSWLSMVKRLQSADWFTAKVCCAGILPAVLQLANSSAALGGGGGGGATPPTSQQLQILQLYRDLCSDETPMVRRAAAQHLGPLLHQAAAMAAPTITAEATQLAATQVAALCHDEQDSIRLLAVAALAQAGPLYGQYQPQWTAQHWIPILRDGATDLSWRVRNNLAKNFSDVANVLCIKGNDAFLQEQNIVMACFVAVLTDTEAEVRSAAVTHLARMIDWGGSQMYLHHLQPLLSSLADDVVLEVRSKCALALMDAAAAPDNVLEDTVILQNFGPLYEAFLQDEFHEVQLQVLCNLHKIAHLLPGLSGVVTSLLQMSKATNWRVREAVARLLPHLAEARGLDFFNKVLLEPVWLTLLLDPVASVRNSIVAGMALLVRVAGPEYCLNTLLPHHVRIFNQSSHTYLIRVTILNAHIETALACQSAPLWQEAISQILRGLVDRVPNVRNITSRGLARIIALHNEDGNGDDAMIQTQIRPALEKCLAEETDVECRPSCQFALDQIKN